jgi:hypothetical protein
VQPAGLITTAAGMAWAWDSGETAPWPLSPVENIILYQIADKLMETRSAAVCVTKHLRRYVAKLLGASVISASWVILRVK